MSKELLLVEQQLKKDQIIQIASTLAKDTSAVRAKGRVEISVNLLNVLDERLLELRLIDMKLKNIDTNNTD